MIIGIENLFIGNRKFKMKRQKYIYSERMVNQRKMSVDIVVVEMFAIL